MRASSHVSHVGVAGVGRAEVGLARHDVVLGLQGPDNPVLAKAGGMDAFPRTVLGFSR